MTSWFRKLTGLVDAQDVALVAGVALLAYGARQVYAPAGWLTAGAVLIWLTLPTRPFPIIFVRRGDAKKQE
jgi:hypothetical protein